MERFELEVYKDCKQYFILFDILLKELDINKEAFLLDNNITPSSYRKCRRGELIIGPKIIEQLAYHFSYKVPTDEFLDELKELFDKVYYNMYYKIYSTYEDDLKRVDELLEDKYLVFPILKLLKIFLKMSSNRSIDAIKEENMDLYIEVKKYEPFFNDSLYEIYELVYLAFEANVTEGKWIKKYNNASAYYILASRSYTQGNYIESLFFATKSKEMLQNDGNVNRLIHLNNIMMSSLLYVENYEECYETASKQLLILESIGQSSSLLAEFTSKFFVVSALGLRKYKRVVKHLENIEEMNLTQLATLLVAQYHLDVCEYNDLFNSLPFDIFEGEERNFLKTLDKYLKHPDKKLLPILEKGDVIKQLIKILKNNVN